KTIRTIPETAAHSARWASNAANSVVESYQSKPNDMAANDAKMLSNLAMASAFMAKVEYLTLVLLHNHAASIASEINSNMKNGKFREAAKLVADLEKIASLARSEREYLKSTVRKSKELTNAASKVTNSIETLSGSMRKKIKDEIERIKKAHEEAIKKLKTA
ncbi:MAG TPA: hypothetical protein VJI46_00205, partial [Candidatus Nanoarchaeia archaeon]|nr:hypothetical protein [Candidatus Nanoarchaeia archaeon]